MHAREKQRGSVLATSAVVLAGLIGVAGLSVLSVQRSLGVSGQQRGHAQALHAAEAGIAAAAAFLRGHLALGANWGVYVDPSCGPQQKDDGTCVGQSPTDIVGNGAAPGSPDNPFDPASRAWYEITLLNNPADSAFASGGDADAIIIIRSTGHGPDSERVVLEVEVQGTATKSADDVCVGYAQQGMSELNSGRTDCGGNFDFNETTTYTPSLP